MAARQPKATQPPAPQKRSAVPTWLAVAVVVVGGTALSFPMYSASLIFQSPVVASAGAFSRGAPVQPVVNDPVAAAALLACRDSDEGFNIAVKGTCFSMLNQTNSTDYCLNNQTLVEFQCLANRCVHSLINCLRYNFTACLNGACVKTPTSHLECVANTCTAVSGPGINKCSPLGSACNLTNQSRPDLTVLSLTSFGGACGGGGNQTNVTCNVVLAGVVKNIGTAAAGSSIARFTDVTSGRAPVIIANVPVSALTAGNQTQVQATYANISLGNYTIELFADATNTVTESNENNNKLARNVTV